MVPTTVWRQTIIPPRSHYWVGLPAGNGREIELGAIQKSFQATPPNCVNILVAGVTTPEMRERLTSLGIGKVFLLDDLAADGAPWVEFLNEVFHCTIRITEARISDS